MNKKLILLFALVLLCLMMAHNWMTRKEMKEFYSPTVIYSEEQDTWYEWNEETLSWDKQ